MNTFVDICSKFMILFFQDLAILGASRWNHELPGVDENWWRNEPRAPKKTSAKSHHVWFPDDLLRK